MKRYITSSSLVFVLVLSFFIIQSPQNAGASWTYNNRVFAMVNDYSNNKMELYQVNPNSGQMYLKKTVDNFIGSTLYQNYDLTQGTDKEHYNVSLIGKDTSSGKMMMKYYNADFYFSESVSQELPGELQQYRFKGSLGGNYFYSDNSLNDVLLAEGPWISNQQWSIRFDGNNPNDPLTYTKSRIVGDRIPSGLQEYSNSFIKNGYRHEINLTFSENGDVQSNIEQKEAVPNFENKTCVAQAYFSDNKGLCSVWASGWFDQNFGVDLYGVKNVRTISSVTSAPVEINKLASYTAGSNQAKYIASFVQDRDGGFIGLSKKTKTSMAIDFSSQNITSPNEYDIPGSITIEDIAKNHEFLGAADFGASSDFSQKTGIPNGFFDRAIVYKNLSNSQHYIMPNEVSNQNQLYALSTPFTTIDDIAYSGQQDSLKATGRFWGSNKTYISKVVFNETNRTASLQPLGSVNKVFKGGLAQISDDTIEVLTDGKIYRLDLPMNGNPNLVEKHTIDTTASDGKTVSSCSSFTAYKNWYYCSINENRTWGNSVNDDYYQISGLNNFKPQYLGTDIASFDIW